MAVADSDDVVTNGPANPVIGYTVKELIARLEGKLDAYAAQTAELTTVVSELIPKVQSIDDRLGKLELIQVSKEAVKKWHTGLGKIGIGFLGALGSFAIAFTSFHVFH